VIALDQRPAGTRCYGAAKTKKDFSMLPFTRAEFLSVFADYNVGVWPVQVVAYLLGFVLVALLFRPSSRNDRLVSAGLALMWAWTGVVYHWLHFTSINNAAWLFGALFVLQAGVFFYAGVARNGIRFGAAGGPTAWLGWALVIYASIVYPLLGIATGHAYPEMPMFGITPCPVTIFTFGLLLLTHARFSRWVFVVPVIWSLIGGSAAFLLGVPQDWLLLVSGVVVPLLILRDRGYWQRPATA
jgi:hypothetical protein